MSGVSTREFKLDKPNELENILEVVYRVRSNLIHGAKTFSDPRDVFLIENSFNSLFEIMYHALKRERII